MRIAAICSESDMCTGFQLAGIDCYHAAAEAELAAVLSILPVAETGILVISEDLAESTALAEFSNANPQILVYNLK